MITRIGYLLHDAPVRHNDAPPRLMMGCSDKRRYGILQYGP